MRKPVSLSSAVRPPTGLVVPGVRKSPQTSPRTLGPERHNNSFIVLVKRRQTLCGHPVHKFHGEALERLGRLYASACVAQGASRAKRFGDSVRLDRYMDSFRRDNRGDFVAAGSYQRMGLGSRRSGAARGERLTAVQPRRARRCGWTRRLFVFGRHVDAIGPGADYGRF